MKKLLALVVLCSVAALGFSQAVAAEAKPDAPAGKDKKVEKKKEGDKPGKPGAIPYKGEITAIDQQAKTVKVGERVFLVTSETKIRKGEKPAILADLAVGEQVTGQYHEAEGKLNALSIYVRGKGEGDKKPKPQGDKPKTGEKEKK